MDQRCTLVWFRQDLRLADHAALAAAMQRGSVLPVFIWAPHELTPWSPGAASRVFLHHALESLQHSLKRLGLPLVICPSDDSLKTLRELITTFGADAVYWHRCYEPRAMARDTAVEAGLQRDGIEVKSFNGSLLYEPHEVKTQAGGPYKVFTPFYNTCLQLPPSPRKLETRQPPARAVSGHGVDVADLKLLPDHGWAMRVASHWSISEQAAMKRLHAFAGQGAGAYTDLRDQPDDDGTSKMSPYLHWGLISPRQVWATLTEARREASPTERKGMDGYLRELIWREFSYHLLYHFPHTADEPLRENFARFPWVDEHDERGRRWLTAWQRGRTGYPIVDAGMRQLWETGWMHNRVRMIVASFLTKDLRLHWLTGARWFWDTLVDADLANNTQGWQWSAGCGADAQPYFRIFNPTTQGKKFDPDGAYVRRWLGERKDHVEPIVDHAEARAAALDAYEQVKARG